MYDIKWIRENAELFDIGRQRRGLEPLAENLLALDDARRAAIAKSQAAQERRNAASKEIGAALKAGDASLAKALKIEVGELKESLAAFETEEREAIAALDKALAEIPNTPLAEVPDGRDENDNVELRRVGEPQHFGFRAERAFRHWRGAGPHGFRDGDENFRRAVRREQGGARAAGARARRNSCSICIRASTATRK